MKTAKRVVISLVALDTVGIALSMALSYYFWVTGNVVPYSGPQNLGAYELIASVVLPVWLVLHALTGLYSLDFLFEGLGEFVRVIRASSFGVVALILASFWGRPVVLSRGWVLITWLLCISFVIGGRFVFRRRLRRWRGLGHLSTSSLIVGVSEHAISLARQLQRSPHAGSRIVGFLDENQPPGSIVCDGLKVLGPPRDLEYLISSMNVSEVIIVPEALAWESLQEIVRHSAAFSSHQVCVRLSPGLYESLTNGGNVYYKASIPMLTIHDFRISGGAAVLKQTLDYAAGAVLLAAMLPVMAAVAIGLVLTRSPGILERQTVRGLRGVPFSQLKFRTGVAAGNRRTLDRASLRPHAHMFFGTIGRWLYLTGFDKAPQLWNVLRGEMSLVGARPIAFIPGQEKSQMRDILSIKPGMTGLWALTPDTRVEHEVASTIYYIRNWSIPLDTQILAKTFKTALSGRLAAVNLQDPIEEFSFDRFGTRAAAAGSGS